MCGNVKVEEKTQDVTKKLIASLHACDKHHQAVELWETAYHIHAGNLIRKHFAFRNPHAFSTTLGNNATDIHRTETYTE